MDHNSIIIFVTLLAFLRKLSWLYHQLMKEQDELNLVSSLTLIRAFFELLYIKEHFLGLFFFDQFPTDAKYGFLLPNLLFSISLSFSFKRVFI